MSHNSQQTEAVPPFAPPSGYATGFSDEDRMNLIRAGWTLARSSRGGYYATNSKNFIEGYGNTVNDALDAVLVRLQGDQKSHNKCLTTPPASDSTCRSTKTDTNVG